MTANALDHFAVLETPCKVHNGAYPRAPADPTSGGRRDRIARADRVGAQQANARTRLAPAAKSARYGPVFRQIEHAAARLAGNGRAHRQLTEHVHRDLLTTACADTIVDLC